MCEGDRAGTSADDVRTRQPPHGEPAQAYRGNRSSLQKRTAGGCRVRAKPTSIPLGATYRRRMLTEQQAGFTVDDAFEFACRLRADPMQMNDPDEPVEP